MKKPGVILNGNYKFGVPYKGNLEKLIQRCGNCDIGFIVKTKEDYKPLRHVEKYLYNFMTNTKFKKWFCVRCHVVPLKQYMPDVVELSEEEINSF